MMRSNNARTSSRARTALGTLIFMTSAASLAAQLPNASPAATGLSNAYTARARGYDAVAWNPANLGMPGNSPFSLTLAAIHGSSGLDPISMSDVAPYSGKDLPAGQREAWLKTVTAAGGENGRMDGGVTFLGISAGPFALQVASSLSGATKLNPDAFEALMFGNAGRTGELKNLNLAGSNIHVGAFTTGGLSYGMSMGGDAKTGSHMAFGVTGKYILGNFVAMAEDNGTSTGTSAVSVNFPAVFSHPDTSKLVGKGFGMDVGFAWSQDRVSFGATVQNVFNSFAWDETKLVSNPGVALFNGNDNTSDFKNAPYAQAPVTLRQKIVDDKFKPTIGVGLAYAWRQSITLSADARQQLGDVLLIGPKTSVGGGIEYRWLPILRLRGGASYVTDGWGVSTGLGLQLGHYEIGAGVSMHTVNSGKEPGITLNLLSIR